MLESFVILIAGLAAGALNSVAGGGTFLTFPALVWYGVPPIMANATATLTALPGYLSSAWAYRNDMKTEGALGLKSILTTAGIGGLFGAGLLLVTSSEAFVALVPWLMLAATALFAVGPALLSLIETRGDARAGPILSTAAIFAVAVYGGYFNGGLGIMLLAVFTLIGFENLHGMNGLKNLLSSLLSVVSATTFWAAGLIAWDAALLMTAATAVGGYAGARVARQIRRTGLLRGVIAGIGLAMTFAFFLV